MPRYTPTGSPVSTVMAWRLTVNQPSSGSPSSRRAHDSPASRVTYAAGFPPMIVRIPTPLRSYTDQRATVEAEGSTLAELLQDLDRRHPGIRFRMVDEQGRVRRHMRVFVNGETAEDLGVAISESDEIVVMQALSGG